jgi:hypothetical protein
MIGLFGTSDYEPAYDYKSERDGKALQVQLHRPRK